MLFRRAKKTSIELSEILSLQLRSENDEVHKVEKNLILVCIAPACLSNFFGYTRYVIFYTSSNLVENLIILTIPTV